MTSMTFKAHSLRDYLFKYYANSTFMSLSHENGNADPKTHIKLQVGAPACQRKLGSILKVV